MSASNESQLRAFFRAVIDRPLDPSDREYVELYPEPSSDPVAMLSKTIKWTPGESVQLLSGFRGTGKSTELRRLRRDLETSGYLVILADLKAYLNLSTSVDVSDFLMAIAGAFSEELSRPEFLGSDPSHRAIWERIIDYFVTTKVDVPELSPSLKAGVSPVPGFQVEAGLALKANLKSDPVFKQKLQERMSGHIGTFSGMVHEYFESCVAALRQKLDGGEVVFLLDSIEQIRGTSVNAAEVQSSVESLFAEHADKLHLPRIHVVYTVPPYLKVKHAGISSLYEPGGLRILPALKIRDRSRQPVEEGLRRLREIIARRGDWRLLFGEGNEGAELLDRVIIASGGHLRDLLRLTAEIIRRCDVPPVSVDVVDAAIRQIRTEYLPITDEDALWLKKISESHRASLRDTSCLPDFARLLDTHLVLCYQNGEEWYDVHPLVEAEVAAQEAALSEQRVPEIREGDGAIDPRG